MQETPQKRIVKRRARQFVPYLMIGAVENEPLSAEAIFVGENVFFDISENQGGFDYF